MYCENDGKIVVKCLPPCYSSIQLRTKRGKYQTGNSKGALKQNPHTPRSQSSSTYAKLSENYSFFFLNKC